MAEQSALALDTPILPVEGHARQISHSNSQVSLSLVKLLQSRLYRSPVCMEISHLCRPEKLISEHIRKNSRPDTSNTVA